LFFITFVVSGKVKLLCSAKFNL